MTILVTGGAGFIGSNIVRRLLNRGEKVRVLDNFSTGYRENLEGVVDRVEVVEGDICDIAAVTMSLEGVDVVLHQAALPSVPRSMKDPIRTHEVNVTGTLNLLVASKRAKVSRFVFASSSSVYGNSHEFRKHENLPPNPLSPYAVSKLAAEQYCLVFAGFSKLEVIILRYFNVFGPFQDPTSQYAAVIPIFLRKLLADERPIIYGDGEQSRDFTYVSNVVEANLAAASRSSSSPHILNVGCGQSTSLNTLIKHLQQLLRKDIQPIYDGVRQGDVRDSLAGIEKARAIIGYEPRVDVFKGLRLTIDWFLQNTKDNR